MQLRDYQVNLIDRIRLAYGEGHRQVLMQLPTGGGKTVCFSFFTKRALERGRRTVIIAHRAEILDQISRTLREVGVPHGTIAAGHPQDLTKPVQVASIQTLVRRLDVYPPPDNVILDEAHHAAAGSWVKLFAAWPKSFRLGVTATPIRLDGKGLSDFFTVLVEGPSMSTLIEAGALARPRYFVPPVKVDVSGFRKVAGDFDKKQIAEALDKADIHGDVVAHYRKLCPGARAIAFCINIDHAEHVASEFQRAGIPSGVIEGTQDPETRRGMVEALGSGRIKVLASCEIVSEGFDLPVVDAAILIRPTMSLGLYMQQVGRALRPAPGKINALIIDHVGNVLRHGRAEDDREWTLDGSRRKKPNTIKNCPQCYCVCEGAARACRECGYSFVEAAAEREAKQQKERIQDRNAQLVELGAKVNQFVKSGELKSFVEHLIAHSIVPDRTMLARKASTEREFQEIGKLLGYKPGWAFHAWRNSKKNPANK